MSIEGFEQQTKPLTEEEFVILRHVIRGLSRRIGKANAVTSREMIMGLRALGFKIEGARIRKIINHIRMNRLVRRLASSSAGYWIEPDDTELRKCILSERQRGSAILAIADVLEKDINHESG